MNKHSFPTLSTNRVDLRVLSLEDSAAVFQHFSDPVVARFVDIPEGVDDVSQASDVIKFHIDDSGVRWGLFLKPSGQMIGTCGYHCWRQGKNSCVEIGFDLAKAHWGKGIMSEVLTIVIDYGFREMAVSRIEGTVDPENRRSRRLMEKLGFNREASLREGLICFYRSREQWLAVR